eukprot:TRINITY_DN72874_c0_g1_i1.p1 TRINITY_DN72874_c0_g1~~TRINITY_DN72874_c0_g1_i1.p1  ORF type:complete len:309 (+),score=42.55 TRINITY_DN72874_c0_g1_i1:57-983(+)
MPPWVPQPAAASRSAMSGGHEDAEALMDDILQEHGAADAVPRTAPVAAAGPVAGLQQAERSPARSPLDDDSPTTSPAAAAPARTPAAASASSNNWDEDSDEECSEGLIVATLPSGQRRRFGSLVGALQSSSLPTGSTVSLCAGTHAWPGGDLHHNISGCGAAHCIIEGNAGGGYFFYLRRNGLCVQDVTLRGTHGGRAYLYVDQLTAVQVRRCCVDGAPYNHCIQVIGSTGVLVDSCELANAVQAAVHVAGSRNVRVVRSDMRRSQGHPAAFMESSGEASGNKFRATSGVYQSCCNGVDVEDNEVAHE